MGNRTLCDVLQAMRDASKSKNFSYLDGLIEEAQNYGNRMEAGLWDQKEFRRAEKKHKKLKAEIRKMRDELGKDEEYI